MAVTHYHSLAVKGDVDITGGFLKNGVSIPDGTVKSVALTVPAFLSVSGSPITVTGTLAVSLLNQSAFTVLAGPSIAGSGLPVFRSLVHEDIPSLDANKITTGIIPLSRGGTGNGSWSGSQRLLWYDPGTSSFNAFNPSTSVLGAGTGTPSQWVPRFTGTNDLYTKVSASGWSATGTGSRSPASGMTLAQIIDVVRTLVSDLKDVGCLAS